MPGFDSPHRLPSPLGPWLYHNHHIWYGNSPYRDVRSGEPSYLGGRERRPATFLGGADALSSFSKFASNSPRLGTGIVSPWGVT